MRKPTAEGSEPGGHGATGNLAVVIAATLPTAHTASQIFTVLAALALALVHDVLIRER